MTTLFISDLHLDEKRPDISTHFHTFLETKATKAEALYILSDLVDQTDQLIIFFLHRKDLSSAIEIINHIRSVIGKVLGVEIKYVIPNKTIPKTTNGCTRHWATSRPYISCKTG